MKGEELRDVRTRYGMTQEHLAAALQVTPNTVARWERDERPIPPTVEVMIKTKVLEDIMSEEFNSIISTLDRERVRFHEQNMGNQAERTAALSRLSKALGKAIKDMEAWEENMQNRRVEQVYVQPRVSFPKNDDPAWTFIRKNRVWDVLTSLRQEKEAIDGILGE